MALSGSKHHQCSRLALHGLFTGFDRDSSGDDLHNRTLANVMIGKALSRAKVDHHHAALRRREQHTRLLSADRRYAWCIGPRLALGALIR
jgi:hypothetical protein